VRNFNSSAQATAANTSSKQFDAGVAVLSLCLILSAAIAFALFVRFSHEIYPLVLFDSDDSGALLYANEMLRQHTLFPDWTTSTGLWLPFLWPVCTTLPVLLAVCHDWMTAYRSAVTIDQILFSLLVWFVLGRVGASRAMRAVLLTFLFAAPSIDYARQTVLIGGKNWIYAQLLTLAFLCYRCLPLSGIERPAGRRRRLRLGLVALLATALFIDRSYIGQLMPPLLAALGVLCVAQTDLSVRQQRRECVLLFGVLLASAACGQFIFGAFFQKASNYHPIAPLFVDLKTAGNNIQLLVRGLVEWFGAAPTPGQAIYSTAAPICAVKLALLMTIFVLPWFVLSQWRQLSDNFLRLLAMLFVVDLALRLFVYIFTDVNQNSTETIRYFVPVSLFGLTICLRFAELHWNLLFVRSASALVAGVLVWASPFAMARPQEPSWQQVLTATAEQQHLLRGYSTWEYADQLTAVADNRVQVRPISLLNGGFVPLHWLSSNHWFDGDPNVHESFLLLSKDQHESDFPAYAGVLGTPTRTLTVGNYRLLVYPFDIAWRLGWRYELNQRLQATDMQALLEAKEPPTRLADGNWTLTVSVTNHGKIPFGTTGAAPVQLGTHLLSADGATRVSDFSRICLPMIEPGQSAQVVVTLPDNGVGGNIVEFDAVQEGVAWFGDAGGKTLRVSIPKPDRALPPVAAH
jgi:hypothetical protein